LAREIEKNCLNDKLLFNVHAPSGDISFKRGTALMLRPSGIIKGWRIHPQRIPAVLKIGRRIGEAYPKDENLDVLIFEKLNSKRKKKR
jgi:hypothetical protein